MGFLKLLVLLLVVFILTVVFRILMGLKNVLFGPLLQSKNERKEGDVTIHTSRRKRKKNKSQSEEEFSDYGKWEKVQGVEDVDGEIVE